MHGASEGSALDPSVNAMVVCFYNTRNWTAADGLQRKLGTLVLGVAALPLSSSPLLGPPL